MYKIIVFDDGNEKYKSYVNQWLIISKMFNGGKVELTNMENNKIKINSISAWKTREKNYIQHLPN